MTTSVTYQCSVCEQQRVSEPAAKLEDGVCCMTCAESHNGPGKFQKWSCSDPEVFREQYAEEMGKALILYEWMGTSGEDDFMSNDGWGYCGRFGSILVMEDTSGFFDFEEFKDEEAAEKKFNEWYNEGWGAQEDDIYLVCERFQGWQAWESGKQIHVWSNHEGEITRERVLAAISLHMRKTGCFPNIWEESSYGTLRNIGSEVW